MVVKNWAYQGISDSGAILYHKKYSLKINGKAKEN